MWLLTSPIGRSISFIAIGLLAAFAAYVAFEAWLSSHDREILKGYVSEVRATRAEAELDRYKHDVAAMKVVADAYQVQYRNVLQQIDIQDVKAEGERKANAAIIEAKGRKRTLDDDDLKFLLRNRSSKIKE